MAGTDDRTMAERLAQDRAQRLHAARLGAAEAGDAEAANAAEREAQVHADRDATSAVSLPWTSGGRRCSSSWPRWSSTARVW